jgi:hypothetical protein
MDKDEDAPYWIEDEYQLFTPHFFTHRGGERKVMGSVRRLKKYLMNGRNGFPKYKQMILDMIEANDGLARSYFHYGHVCGVTCFIAEQPTHFPLQDVH